MWFRIKVASFCLTRKYPSGSNCVGGGWRAVAAWTILRRNSTQLWMHKLRRSCSDLEEGRFRLSSIGPLYGYKELKKDVAVYFHRSSCLEEDHLQHGYSSYLKPWTFPSCHRRPRQKCQLRVLRQHRVAFVDQRSLHPIYIFRIYFS